MRAIEGSIFSHVNFENPSQTKIDVSLAQYPPLEVHTFDDLVKKIAFLSYHNMDHLLFFRGQRNNHKNKNKSSSFFPSIYRTQNDEILQNNILVERFKLLDQASTLLVNKFIDNRIDGYIDLKRRKLIQWSILQHYEVCNTPLIDVTQSIRVACSFALSKDVKEGYIFVFGLPYFTNRISINSEQDIVNIRLINICPPQALRPYFQEGYLVGTADITTDYEKKTDLDMKNRLIAKFKIFNTPKFWGTQKSLEEYLIPRNDEIEVLCKQIKEEIKEQNNIEAMFPGVWRNDFEFEDGTGNNEQFRIINGSEYFCHGRICLNLDNIFVDKIQGILKFRKVGVGTDTRKAFNELQIIDVNRYEGFETPRTKVKYTRVE